MRLYGFADFEEDCWFVVSDFCRDVVMRGVVSCASGSSGFCVEVAMIERDGRVSGCFAYAIWTLEVRSDKI
jgi:hypothetical protein